jgi:polyisoprenyl-phosphate glycosyltransferase
MLLSFVFSFRNEQDNIAELLRRTEQAVRSIDGLEYECIFVNDDSTDRSLELLMSLRDRYPITVVNMSRRFGVTPCVLAGLAQARGEAVVYMDADLQDPPELVPELFKKFQSGADVVHTVRTHREGEGALKMWATRRAYRLINRFSDINLLENAGDFKLLSARAAREILQLREYDPYMRGLSVWVGFRQDVVFYRREARFRGTTKFPLFSRGPFLEFLRGMTAYSAAPLYMSLVLGLLTTVFAIALIFYAVITKWLGSAAPGVSGVLIAMAMFNGMVLITNGVIGIYLARIYYEGKSRPRYIVSSVIDDRGPASSSS